MTSGLDAPRPPGEPPAAPHLQHVHDIVVGLPETKNGKIMRSTVRARFLGGNLSAHDALTPLEFISALT